MCRIPQHSKKTYLATFIALLCFSLMAIPMRLQPHFHPDLMDGIRGAFLGIAIGAMILTVRRMRRAS